jgi:hypothetical protein
VDKTVGVGAILERCVSSLVANWLERTKQIPELNQLQLSDEERTDHLPKLVQDLVVRLGKVRTTANGSEGGCACFACPHGTVKAQLPRVRAKLARSAHLKPIRGRSRTVWDRLLL